MKITVCTIVICLFALDAAMASLSTKQLISQQDLEIDATTRFSVIEHLIKVLNESYVFPEKAKEIEEDLRERLKNNEYDGITSSKTFAEKLTEEIQFISNDKHFYVRYSVKALPDREEKHVPTPKEKTEDAELNKRLNFGFEKVECMPGNIGYINLRGFLDPEAGAETVAAAMTFISNTESLIFDLRQNDGGDPGMVALISSYLFGDEPIHLNDLYWRQENRTEQFWTRPILAKIKYRKDVYILTSLKTFSAAEEFCYNLKYLKRATIIGENTLGGANPGHEVYLSEHFSIFVPTGRAINPITKTNWEGTGIEPNIKVPEKQALKVTYLIALKKSVDTIKNKKIKENVQSLIEQTQIDLSMNDNKKE